VMGDASRWAKHGGAQEAASSPRPAGERVG
jgi:hypothetical protein